MFSTKKEKADILRYIHFEHDEPQEVVAKRPYRIVGIRDVEIANMNYDTRIESEQKLKVRPIRNAYGASNFISLYIDKLDSLQQYLEEQDIPFDCENDTGGEDKIIIKPEHYENKENAIFDLCERPALVEIIQATSSMIEEFESNELTPDDIVPDEEIEEPEPFKFKATIEPSE